MHARHLDFISSGAVGFSITVSQYCEHQLKMRLLTASSNTWREDLGRLAAYE